jgi:hypothetical protein
MPVAAHLGSGIIQGGRQCAVCINAFFDIAWNKGFPGRLDAVSGFGLA